MLAKIIPNHWTDVIGVEKTNLEETTMKTRFIRLITECETESTFESTLNEKILEKKLNSDPKTRN